MTSLPAVRAHKHTTQQCHNDNIRYATTKIATRCTQAQLNTENTQWTERNANGSALNTTINNKSETSTSTRHRLQPWNLHTRLYHIANDSWTRLPATELRCDLASHLPV